MHHAKHQILLVGKILKPILKPPKIILCLMLRLMKHSTDAVMRVQKGGGLL